jgi:hypothetical protein
MRGVVEARLARALIIALWIAERGECVGYDAQVEIW